ncbi:MAG: transcription-repair coupling factor [Acidobacteria bacterium]|nr:transcription-repair coupling factor [Acidobacteriota bacterium]
MHSKELLLPSLISSLQGHPSFEKLLAAWQRPSLRLSGLTSSAAALFLTLLQKHTGQRFVCILEDNSAGEVLHRELKFFKRLLQAAGEIAVLPTFEADPYRGLSVHPEIAQQRVVALWAALEKRCDTLIVPLYSWMQKLNPLDPFRKGWIRLEAGQSISLQQLIHQLQDMGYVNEDPVSGVGEFTHRGGILDLFSPQEARPARLEFFGDSLESLRYYDPATQRSVAYVSSVTVLPMREDTPNAEEIHQWGEVALERWGGGQYSRALDERFLLAEHGQAFPGMEFVLPLTLKRTASVVDVMPDATLVLLEPEYITERQDRIWKQLQEQFEIRKTARDVVLSPDELFFHRPADTFARKLEIRELDVMDSRESIHFSALPARSFGGLIRDLVEHVGGELKNRHQFVFVMQTLGTGERLRDIFRDYGLSAQIGTNADQVNSSLFISTGELSRGFTLPEVQISFYRQQDIFREEKRQPHRAPQRDHRGIFVSDLRELKEGDHVVHIDHGIGLFQGLKHIGVGDTTKEFVLLAYHDDDRLYVPVERLDLIQKYSASGTAKPTLDKLGGSTWEKTKARVRKAMRDMAEELLRLYAQRKAIAGYAFSRDDAMQKEFEDSFEFQETPDQKSAIEEVKRDMESRRPVDRLICGDVGYGKTEVAMRAAFKAVLDRKQVALLAPTTVLAFQHFNTFQDRFKAFPVNIEMISRFRTKAEQGEILEKTEHGRIDILIGTHRILSKDVKFYDLGLVIVDEEQRFGVAQKEWLKKMKTRVDVITLSATPIPRTLHMSLLGLRDLSIIETPPQDRMAIQTVVLRFDKESIRSAIEMETQREGQVFFVHNRVESIYSMANLVQRICPRVRVGVAHGQMSERDLEEVMLRFVQYHYDVLVCTTIIENGLDIPRANTIIVNRADRYGLSQLYQLRGRVGRSNRRAYAYLLIPPRDLLSPVARKRLAAIREFSDLGAGFRVAALDLEIRGAGNLLGGAQHGHINAVGFEMYTQLLQRTVRELRGEMIEEDFRASIDLEFDIRVPLHYIDDSNQRLRLYKRISGTRDEEELEKVREEIADRFGQFPHSVDNLFHYARLRMLAEKMRVTSIERKGQEILFKFAPDARIQGQKLIDRAKRDHRFAFTPGGILRFHVNHQDLGLISGQIVELLQEIRA